MRADDTVRLHHMIEACELVGEFVNGRDRTDLDGEVTSTPDMKPPAAIC